MTLMRAALSLLVALGVMLASCAPPAPSVGSGPTVAAAPTADTRGSVVRLAWEDVGVPTPFRISTNGPGGAVMLTLLYDTLTWKDERGLIPWLASRWDVSADGREYSFTLSPGVTWQDGQALTAADVAFSFAYYANHPYRWTSTDVVESATAVGADQVRIRLRQPFAPFLEDIAGAVPIVPEHIWARVDKPETYDGPDASIGSGPFRLAEYRPADGAYRLTANPTYFRGPVAVSEFQQLNIPPETRVQALQRGEIDLAWSTDASVLDLFKGHPRDKVLETPPLSIVRLAVNSEQPPLDRPEVRQALLYALDRATLGQIITRAAPIVASAGVIPPESPWFAPGLQDYPFDPGRARGLLGGLTATLELLALPTYREPELLAPMLQAVGITLVTRRVDDATRAQLVRERRFQLVELQHIGVGGDPDFLRRWSAGQETNDAAQGFVWRDASFAQLAAAQAATLDPTQRKAIVFDMQHLLADQVPTIPLYVRRFYWLYDSTRYTPMNTWGGLMNGIPLAQNKLTFLRR
jgi:peptide/nickel transport system substrate-binding protein